MSQQLKDSLLPNIASAEAGGDNRNRATPNQKYQNKKAVELEDLHISIGKRIFAQMDVIVMFLNTITAVFSISAAVSLIPQYDYSSYTFCDYGSPVAIGVQCPYLPSPVFISFFVAWTFYFIGLISYKWYHTNDYWSNDLRFYLVCDNLHNTYVMKCFIIIGFILTIVSAIGGITFVFKNGSTASLGSIFVFASVNFYNLSKMMSSRMKVLAQIDIIGDLPHPVYIKLPPSLTDGHMQGVTLNHNEVFEYLYQAVAISTMVGDEQRLAAFGDPTVLKQVALILAPKELKIDR